MWWHLEPPAFRHPDRTTLEMAEETLGQIAGFLASEEVPWPLQRQIERQRVQIHEAADYLLKTTHHIACIGPIGVGKSTALSFLFSLLKPEAARGGLADRVVLESGGGGTTLCEVRVRRGRDYGIVVHPLAEDEVHALVRDFCAARWLQARSKGDEAGDPAIVSNEADRAIRNMAGLAAKAQRGRDGKVIRHDLVAELVETCNSEEELLIKVLDRMQLHERTRRELWFDASMGKPPLSWMSETFSALNKGRIADAPWPEAVDLLMPDFGKEAGELEIVVVDTKGIDDIAVREDLDARLKDARTAIVLCSRFEDAPGAAGGGFRNEAQRVKRRGSGCPCQAP
jgi:hypothetical protein